MQHDRDLRIYTHAAFGVFVLALLTACTDPGANRTSGAPASARANDAGQAFPSCVQGLAPRPYAGEVPLEIPSGQTLLVIGQTQEQMHEYVDAVGAVPAGFMVYLMLQSSLDGFQSQLASFSEFLACYPGALINIGLTMGESPIWSTLFGDPAPPGGLSVINGEYDAQIDALGDWMNRLGHIVHLRIGYEFDLLGGQWGPAPVYQQAYRHIVDRLRAKDVRNAAYIWHSAGAFFRAFDYSGLTGLLGSADGSGTSEPAIRGIADVAHALSAAGMSTDFFPIADYYPGEGYVDYFGISFWGDSCCFGESSQAGKAMYLQRTRELLAEAQAMGLPIVMGEATPAYIGTVSGPKSLDWLNQHFELIEEFDIRSSAYINQDWLRAGSTWGEPYWGGFWPDSRVQADPEVQELWEHWIGTERFR